MRVVMDRCFGGRHRPSMKRRRPDVARPLRFLHTADWQLGLKLAFVAGDAGRGGAISALRGGPAARRRIAKEREVDAVVVAGDVFDDNAVGEDSLQRARDALAQFAPIPVLLLPGNHDAATPDCVLARLARRRARPRAPRRRAVRPPARPLPPVPAPPPPRARRPARALPAGAPPGDPILVAIAHGALIDFTEGLESKNVIDWRAVLAKGYDYLALGDWHGTLSFDPRVWYSGAPEPTRFKEKRPGYALVVEIDAPGATPRVEEVAVARTRWIENDGSISPSDESVGEVERFFASDGRALDDARERVARRSRVARRARAAGRDPRPGPRLFDAPAHGRRASSTTGRARRISGRSRWTGSSDAQWRRSGASVPGGGRCAPPSPSLRGRGAAMRIVSLCGGGVEGARACGAHRVGSGPEPHRRTERVRKDAPRIGAPLCALRALQGGVGGQEGASLVRVDQAAERRSTVRDARDAVDGEKAVPEAGVREARGGGRTWTDDDAESMLRDLLGTKPIQGRRDIDQFFGLWPLLWVKQGDGGIAPQAHMNDDARARLRDVLASQVNGVAAGPLGERMVARAEAERERYFTATTGKETGELAIARTRFAAAEGALAEAVAKRGEAHAAADELAALRREIEEIDAKIAAAERARCGGGGAGGEGEGYRGKAPGARGGRGATARRSGARGAGARSQREEMAERAAQVDRRIAEEGATLRARAATQSELAAREAEATERAEICNCRHSSAPTPITFERAGARTCTRPHAESTRSPSGSRGRRRSKRASSSSARSSPEARIDEAQIQRLRRASEGLAKTSAALAAASASLRMRAARDLVVDGAAAGRRRRADLDVRRASPRRHRRGRRARDPPGRRGPRRAASERAGGEPRAGERARTAGRGERRRGRGSLRAPHRARRAARTGGAAPSRGSAGRCLRAGGRGPRASHGAGSAGGADSDAISIADADAKLAATHGGCYASAGGAGRAPARARARAWRRSRVTNRRRPAARARARRRDRPPRRASDARGARVEQLGAARSAWVDARAVAEALAEELKRNPAKRARSLRSSRRRRILERLEAERTAKHARSLALDATVRVHGGEDLHERVQRAESGAERARRDAPRDRGARRRRPPARERAPRRPPRGAAAPRRAGDRAGPPLPRGAPPRSPAAHGRELAASSGSARGTWRKSSRRSPEAPRSR